MTQKNKNDLYSFVEYVEEKLPKLQKITIGQIRDENDYYNDCAENVVPIEEYAARINKFIRIYRGRLDVDIFSKGILETPNLPKFQPDQINRFRAVFPDKKYTDCLYKIALLEKKPLDLTKPFSFPYTTVCPMTGKCRCITDKIKLRQIAMKK